MVQRLIEFCVRHRPLVIFGVLLVGVLGVRAAKTLPVDAVPDVTNVQVQVLTNAPSLGPEEVERYITVPIEAAMSGLPKLHEVRSLSRFGLSAVTVVFDEGTDLHFARQIVSERLSQARGGIPQAYGSPELGPLSSGLGEIYQFEVRGEPACLEGGADTPACYSLMEMRSILDWFVSYQLKPIRGVVEVNSFGGELKTYEVQVDPKRLAAYNLSLDDLYDTLRANNANAGGGYVVENGEQRLIRGEALVESLEDIRQVVVKTDRDGTPIFVQDVATVALAPMIRQGAVTRDARGEVVTGTVMMLMGANSRQVSDRVRQRIDALQARLPKGVSIQTYYDRSDLVDRTLTTVAINLVEGGVLVIVVLLLLLGNVRGGLLVASVIPLSLLATFIVMNLAGVSGNLMSLGALDFGLIIDGAVVIVENIVRTLGQGQRQGESVPDAVKRATAQVARPVIFGTAIIMIVYLPILSLRGIEGKMFRPMAITVLAALGAALVLALTLMPSAAAWVYRKGVDEKKPWLFRQAEALYIPLLQAAVRHRWVTLGLAILGLGVAAAIAPRLGAEFIPRLDEGTVAMQAVRLPSVALEESIKATGRIEATLLDHFPAEIETIVSKTGRPEIATDPMGVEMSDIYITLKPQETWKKVQNKAGLVNAMREVLEREVPGQAYSFSQPIELRTNELISGARSDVAINLYGPDLEELGRVGDRVMQLVQDVPGAADVQADQIAGLPTLRVKVDRGAAARYGLSANDILSTVSALSGQEVGVVMEGQQRYALQVRIHAQARRDLEHIGDLLVATPDGRHVPLEQVARVHLDQGPAVISRHNAQRRRTIQVNVQGRDLAGFVAQAKQKLAQEGVLPPGYVVTWGGQFENLEQASGRLAVAVPAALALIFLLLYMTYGSARPALIIYLNIPVAAVGGVLALWARGMPFSISAAVGFIALSGIAVLNGVVLVSCIRDLQAEGRPLFEATLEGATLRLRAVLMTALTDGIGFLPMALSTGAGAEVQQPLATVVVGGLVTATALTLLVLPALYSKFGGQVDTTIPPQADSPALPHPPKAP